MGKRMTTTLRGPIPVPADLLMRGAVLSYGWKNSSSLG